MTLPLLQLTSVTKSFGAVRALKGVSFDLYREAVPEGSRRSQQRADLRSKSQTQRHPSRVPEASTIRTLKQQPCASGIPPGCFPFPRFVPEVSTAFRPPATLWQPFGLRPLNQCT